MDNQAEHLPYDKKYEFPRNQLVLGHRIGSGAFRVVLKAKAYGICNDEKITTVAVKTVQRSADIASIRGLANELKIMIYIGKHLNVVNVLGACTNNIIKRQFLVIVEYCRFGNLHDYLLRHRSNFINQIDPVTGKMDFTIGKKNLKNDVQNIDDQAVDEDAINSDPASAILGAKSSNSNEPELEKTSNPPGKKKNANPKPICTEDVMLCWAFQVVQGMDYLCHRKVLHGDLAASNIVLAGDNVVNICDFGLAKSLYNYSKYKKQSDGPVPMKWMALESIRDRDFSTKSDVWSFGVALWELFSLGNTPYPAMEAEDQYRKLIEGYRMEKPEYATEDVYDIMFQCWRSDPQMRPTFAELINRIGGLMDQDIRLHYIRMNEPYMAMNRNLNEYMIMRSVPHHPLSCAAHDYENVPQ